jgi:hypothetical protein
LVGDTSKGRKGTAHAHVIRLFESVDADWSGNRIQGGLSSGEGLIWAVRDPIVKREPVREKGRPTGDYVDVETDQGEDDKRLLAFEGEYAGVLRVLGRDGNTLSAVIRQAWDTGSLRILTKNSPAKATGAHISILGHITADELRRYLNSTEAGNGFGNRFLWACVRRSNCLPEGGRIQEVNFAEPLHRLGEAVAFGGEARELKRDERARALWIDVYQDLSEGRRGMVGALTSRAEAQAMRLAAIYALLDCSLAIREEHLTAGLALWRYCEQSVQYLFGDVLGDPVADEILRALDRARVALPTKADTGSEGRRETGLSRTEIRDLFKRHQKAARIEHALELLESSGLVWCQSTTTSGRPEVRWFSSRWACDKSDESDRRGG